MAAAALVLAAGPCAAATPDALQADAQALLRRADAQQQALAQVQERMRSGPLSWPAWWGCLAAAAVIGLAAWAARRRVQVLHVEVDDSIDAEDGHAFAYFGHAPRSEPAGPVGRPDPDPDPEPVVVGVGQAQAETIATAQQSAVPVVSAVPDLPARADALLMLLGELDFLSSIGLQHGAVEALEQYLARTESPAPLAWLELADLHRREGEPGEAMATWSRFLARAPQGTADLDVDRVLDAEGDGLETFPAVLARVQAAWDGPSAEEQLATELMAPDPSSPLLSLAAGRELAWLLQVRHAFATPEDQPAVQAADVDVDVDAAFDRTLVLSASDWVRQLGAYGIAPRDDALAVDIDLGVPNWIDEAKASVRVGGTTRSAAPQLALAEAGDSSIDLFDAATGSERHRAAFRVDPIYR